MSCCPCFGPVVPKKEASNTQANAEEKTVTEKTVEKKQDLVAEAKDALKKALAGTDVEVLRKAIDSGKDAGLPDSELAAAENILKQHLAREALKKAVKGKDADALRKAIAEGEAAELEQGELQGELSDAKKALEQCLARDALKTAVKLASEAISAHGKSYDGVWALRGSNVQYCIKGGKIANHDNWGFVDQGDGKCQLVAGKNNYSGVLDADGSSIMWGTQSDDHVWLRSHQVAAGLKKAIAAAQDVGLKEQDLAAAQAVLEQSAAVRIHVKNGIGFKQTDWFSNSDFYVKLHLVDASGKHASEHQKSKVIDDGSEAPSWDETFTFKDIDNSDAVSLELIILDKDTLLGLSFAAADNLVDDDVLGKATTSLAILPISGEFLEKEINIYKGSEKTSSIVIGIAWGAVM